MPVAELVAGGLKLGASLLGSSSADKASKRARKSHKEALAESRRQFDTAQDNLRPTLDAGNTARDQLLSLLGIGGDPSGAIDQIRNTPGFQFQTEQGTRALNANRSAGGTSGGALLRDFSRFNQGVASSFYSDYANRLQQIASGGSSAAVIGGNQAIDQGQIAGQHIVGAGNARAGGILGKSNAFQSFLEEIGGAIGEGAFDNLFNRNPIGPTGGAQRVSA